MLIIGIAGGTGCGKTTVVEQIIAQLPVDEVCVISQDSYYKDTSDLSYQERVKINFDHPNSIDFDLLLQHLKALRDGASFEQPVYSFVEHNRTGETITTHPKKVVIVEGILILTQPEIRAMALISGCVSIKIPSTITTFFGCVVIVSPVRLCSTKEYTGCSKEAPSRKAFKCCNSKSKSIELG